MNPNLRPAGFVFAVLLAVAWWQNSPVPLPGSMLFVAEHGHIASALVHGEGYANPFGTPSGPTAWTPPVFPTVLAGVFWTFGIKTVAAVRALLVLDSLFAAATVFFMLCALDLAGQPRAKRWFTPALLALVAIHQLALGPWLTTAWFVAMLTAALLAAALGVWFARGPGWRRLLIGICFLLPLTHAGSGLAAGLIVVVLALRSVRVGGLPAARPLVAPALAGVLAVGGWTARNYAVFHQFIPLKAAGAFEVWLAEARTRNGVITDATMLAFHPLCSAPALTDYTARGEKAYLADFGPRARAVLAAEGTATWLRHVAARAGNVFLYCDTSPSALGLNHPPSPADATRLIDAGLAVRSGDSLVWVSLDVPPAEFGRRAAAAHLDALPAIAAEWLGARAYADRQGSRLSAVASAWLLGAIPVACLLIALALRGPAPELVLGGLIYVVALLPNVLVTHYLAHQLHFLALHALFLVSAATALLARPHRTSPSTPSANNLPS